MTQTEEVREMGMVDRRMLEVRVAETADEREAVFRARYDIYVEELGRYRTVADHEHRRLADPEDETSWIVYATDGVDVVGSMRITWGGHGFSPRQLQQYRLAPFLAEIPAERMSVGERTMISPSWRGEDIFGTLGEGGSALSSDHDVRVVFGACEPHLISFYARYQRPYGGRNINSPEAGLLVPLVCFPQGEDALREFGTGGSLPGCIESVLAGDASTVSSPLLIGDEPYETLVLDAVATLDSSVFDGLTPDEIVRCVRRSNVLTCHEDDRLLKVGGSAHNVFVLLSGRLEVSRDGEPVGTIGPGEVVGEMAHLLRQPRAFDVDVTEPGTRLLSLSDRTLARLADDDPATSARLLSNISRQLCRRLVRAQVAS
jgi:hypothetical protein